MAPFRGFAALAARRRTIRGFLPDPLPRAAVADLRAQARTAPSGANLPPGRFIALTAAQLAALVEAPITATWKGSAPTFPTPPKKSLRHPLDGPRHP